MKALLIKDYYMIVKYCRLYLLLVAVFLAVSAASPENAFFRFYPSVMLGMIPMTLMAYDEQARWDKYSAGLPITKNQRVSEKYLLGLMMLVVIVLLSVAASVIAQARSGGVSVNATLLEAAFICSFALFVPAISLPMLFGFGVEKGRMAIFVIIGALCALCLIVSRGLSDSIGTELVNNVYLRFVPLAAAILYAVSWRISTAVYGRREV